MSLKELLPISIAHTKLVFEERATEEEESKPARSRSEIISPPIGYVIIHCVKNIPPFRLYLMPIFI
jgi:hypothetical protein